MNQLPTTSQSEAEYINKLKSYGVATSLEPKAKGAFKRIYSTLIPGQIAVLSSPRNNPNKKMAVLNARQELFILELLRGAPHIPVCYDSFFVLHERYCLIQEDYGKDLHQAAPLTLPEIRTTAKNCLEALVYMHERNIGHFDIKPANMTQKGLIDFGTAERLHGQESDGRFMTLHARRGTPSLWPPEVLGAKRKYLASDLFSLGISLFEAFTDTNFFCPIAPYDDDPLQHDIDQLRAYEVRMNVTLAWHEGIKDCFDSNKVLKKSRREPPNTLFFELRVAAHKCKINPSDVDFLAFENLLKQMLLLDWKTRITAKQALAHPFFEKT